MADSDSDSLPDEAAAAKERARRNLRNVLILAVADGEVTEEETACIERLRERLGVDPDEFADLCQAIRQGDRRISISREPAAADQTLSLLVELAVADGKVSQAEERTLRKIAAHVGVAAGSLENLIDRALRPPDMDDMKIAAMVEEIYRGFAGWDEAARRGKLQSLADLGRYAVKPLVRILESYRKPDETPDALGLKVLVAERLGELGDVRPVYYLAQQATLGDTDDEISNSELRAAAAEAIGKITGQGFSRDEDGVNEARLWWRGEGTRQYNYLIY